MDIAICIIAYNRENSLKRLLQFIKEAYYPQNAKLYISIDHSECKSVENIAYNFYWEHGEKEVIIHEKKLGLRKHILRCGNLLNSHDALIVLEDDIVVSPDFFNYALVTTKKYHNYNDIAGISLYNFPVSYHCQLPFIPLTSDSDVFLMQNAQSWGQIWMKKQWFDFIDWYKENNDNFQECSHLPKSICNWPKSSWLKFHTKYCIEENKFFIYPYKSRSTCFSDIGEHTRSQTNIFQTFLLPSICNSYLLNPTVKYDCFFENIAIATWLGIPSNDICIDFYGDKANRGKHRYWLTRQQLPYKIIQSYALSMKPYELNIKYNIKGNDLFLYDTTESREIIDDINCTKRQYFYIYNTHMPVFPSTNETLHSVFGQYLKFFLFEMNVISKIRALWHWLKR